MTSLWLCVGLLSWLGHAEMTWGRWNGADGPASSVLLHSPPWYAASQLNEGLFKCIRSWGTRTAVCLLCLQDKNSAESASSYRSASHSSSDYWSFSNANSGEVPGYHMLASASVGHGSGWQSLLHDLEPPPVLNAPGKRGRRPSQGVIARK